MLHVNQLRSDPWTRKRPLLRWDGIFANADSESRSWFNFHPEILLFEHFVILWSRRLPKDLVFCLKYFFVIFTLQTGFVYFHPEVWGRFSFWLIIFKGVETTNQTKTTLKLEICASGLLKVIVFPKAPLVSPGTLRRDPCQYPTIARDWGAQVNFGVVLKWWDIPPWKWFKCLNFLYWWTPKARF